MNMDFEEEMLSALEMRELDMDADFEENSMKSLSCTEIYDNVIDTVKDYELTPIGQEYLKKWIKNMQENTFKNALEQNIRDYPKACRSEFCNAKRQMAPKMILDLIKMCSTKAPISEEVSEKPTLQELSKLQKDAVAYLGGYCLQKASVKFVGTVEQHIIKMLSSDTTDSIRIMEYRVGCLKYCSSDLLLLLEFIFKITYNETDNQKSCVNMNNVTTKVHNSEELNHFLNALYDEIDYTITNHYTYSTVIYLVNLFIRVLGFTVVKKMISTLLIGASKGLRGDLKKKREANTKKSTNK